MKIGFISTRLAGTDGVSLETAKWATVLERMGHQVFYCVGELEIGGPLGRLIPELHFRDEEAIAIGQRTFGTTLPDPALLNRIQARAAQLREALYSFINDNEIDLIIAENVLAIPMQIPLGVALRDLIASMDIPTIAHHHDFYWERERFRTNCISDILESAFPPDLPSIRHVVINSLAQRELKARREIESLCIPNVFDFNAPPRKIDDFNADFRQAFGLTEEDILILQPTRVVPRKGIELAIELVRRLNAPRFKLVISHQARDEGFDYYHWLQARATEADIELHFIADRIDTARRTEDKEKVYSLWDVYLHADLVTYPSLYEGFGNALIETVCFKKPLFVNRYPVYEVDIKPKGFDFIEIDGQVTDEAVEQVRQVVADPNQRQEMVERNFRLGQEHYSYEVLEDRLSSVLAHF